MANKTNTQPDIQVLENKLRLIGFQIVHKNSFGLTYKGPTDKQYSLYRLIENNKLYRNKDSYDRIMVHRHFIVCYTSAPYITEIYINGKKDDIIKDLSYASTTIYADIPQIILAQAMNKILIINYLGHIIELNRLLKDIKSKSITNIEMELDYPNTSQFNIFGYNTHTDERELYYTLEIDTLRNST